MQVPRDTCAFILLAVDQTAGEVLVLLVEDWRSACFGAAAPGTLDHQSDDERGLQGEDKRPTQNVGSINSQAPGCLNRIVLFAGSRLSPMFQRWSWRQSNCVVSNRPR